MSNPDKLYFSSERYRHLIDKIGGSISTEEFEKKKGNQIEACKHGEKVWNYLQELMKLLHAKSVFELDQRHTTTYDLLYWASEFTDELHNASLKDKNFVPKKLEFCENYLEMHSNMLNKEVRNLGNIKISLAETYYQLGKEIEADALFRKWLSVEPDWGWGWIGWSDCYWLWGNPKQKDNFDKAEKILDEGLSIPAVSDILYIKERISDLHKRKLLLT